jgi:hypothetical protein
VNIKMRSPEHYDAAEKLLEEAESHYEPDARAEWCLELAKVHLALAQAANAAQALDFRRQEITPGPRFRPGGPPSRGPGHGP